MGLFAAQSRSRTGWLAAFQKFLHSICGCRSAHAEDDALRVMDNAPSLQDHAHYERPIFITPPIPPPYQSHLSYRSPIPDHVVLQPRPIARPASLKIVDQDDDSLLSDEPRIYPSRPGSYSSHVRRSAIGPPISLRRLDYTDRQRQALVPLKLNPVVLRDVAFTSPNNPVELVDHRDTDRLRELKLQASPSPRVDVLATPRSVLGESVTPTSLSHDNPTLEPRLSYQSSSSSLRSPRRSGMDTSTSSTVLRPSTERHRPKRTRSDMLSKKYSGEKLDADVDREVLELNTIVEERRAESSRQRSLDGDHIPAVAPAMAVRARSETLTDIGSAFSRPLTAHPSLRPTAPLSPFAAPSETLQRPSTSQGFTTPSRSMSTPRTSSRITGWLASLLPSSPTSSSHQPSHPSRNRFSSTSTSTTTPLRTPRPRRSAASFSTHARPSAAAASASETSLFTFTTLPTDYSPALTAASSSPVSHKGHSRSLTAESRITLSSSAAPNLHPDHRSWSTSTSRHHKNVSLEMDLADATPHDPPRWPVVVARDDSQVGLAF